MGGRGTRYWLTLQHVLSDVTALTLLHVLGDGQPRRAAGGAEDAEHSHGAAGEGSLHSSVSRVLPNKPLPGEWRGWSGINAAIGILNFCLIHDWLELGRRMVESD